MKNTKYKKLAKVIMMNIRLDNDFQDCGHIHHVYPPKWTWQIAKALKELFRLNPMLTVNEKLIDMLDNDFENMSTIYQKMPGMKKVDETLVDFFHDLCEPKKREIER